MISRHSFLTQRLLMYDKVYLSKLKVWRGLALVCWDFEENHLERISEAACHDIEVAFPNVLNFEVVCPWLTNSWNGRFLIDQPFEGWTHCALYVTFPSIVLKIFSLDQQTLGGWLVLTDCQSDFPLTGLLSHNQLP